jgi:hypothetical protein
MADPKTGTQYRAKWTYPYLENRGEFEYGPARYSKEDAVRDIKDDGWHWAGKPLGYESREVVFEATDWTVVHDG